MMKAEIPLRFGSPEQFAALREIFLKHGYTEEDACERLGLKRIHDAHTHFDERKTPLEIVTSLDALLGIFLGGGAAPVEEVRAVLASEELALLEWSGLLERFQHEEGERYQSTVLLYPTESLYLISDRTAPPGRPEKEGLRVDHVFSAISPNTADFLRNLPHTPCGSFLELCSGTGIGALVASRYATHSYAVDITERSTVFADFNARLNGLENVTALQGDLYEPVAGRTFDRIVAHPPYIPTSEVRLIFRDGGADGEQITRRVIEGIPDHLAPGGTFYCTCFMTDREDAPLEGRIRQMLGEHADAFDVAVVIGSSVHPSEYAFRLMVQEKLSGEEAERMHLTFRQLKVAQILYCNIAVRRHGEARSGLTLRRRRSIRTSAAHTEWLLDVEARAADPATLDAILDARPLVSSEAMLHVEQSLTNSKPAKYAVKVEVPFNTSLDASLGVVELLSRCDGSRTVREHLQLVKERGNVPADLDEQDFAKIIMELVTGGFVELLPATGQDEGPQYGSLENSVTPVAARTE